jgi:hypothetical protein
MKLLLIFLFSITVWLAESWGLADIAGMGFSRALGITWAIDGAITLGYVSKELFR